MFPGNLRESAPEAVDADVRSIAVLPFVNMSEDPANEYFSDGIAEEILNVLAKSPELRVAARTSSFSFKGQAKEIPDIARELEVRMVLEGSVRKQGDRVRITAQLIDAEKGFHLWSKTYDRDLKDVFAIQDEIAREIGKQLQVQLGGGLRTRAGNYDHVAVLQSSTPSVEDPLRLLLHPAGRPVAARPSRRTHAWVGGRRRHRHGATPRASGTE